MPKKESFGGYPVPKRVRAQGYEDSILRLWCES